MGKIILKIRQSMMRLTLADFFYLCGVFIAGVFFAAVFIWMMVFFARSVKMVAVTDTGEVLPPSTIDEAAFNRVLRKLSIATTTLTVTASATTTPPILKN